MSLKCRNYDIESQNYEKKNKILRLKAQVWKKISKRLKIEMMRK